MDASATLPHRMPVLQSPDYRRLLANTFLAAGARWAMVIGRGWLVHEMTGSATAVGAVTFAAFFPFVVVGPLAGVVADRVDRRSLVLASGAVGIATALALAVITLADVVTVWHVIGLAAVSGTAQAAAMPARQALLANLVAREQLLSGIALASIAQQGSRVFGPLAGGALLATLGAGYVFLAGAAMLLLSQYPIWRITHRLERAAGEVAAESVRGVRGFLRELREGVAYVERDRRLALVFALVMLHCGLTMSFDSMMPTLATVVGGADRTYTALFVGMGIGAALSGLVLSMPRAPAITGRALAFTGIGSGVSMLLLGVAPTPSLIVVAAGLAGATQMAYMTVTATLIQQVVPDRLRGRVMALYMMVATSNMAFLNFGFGWAADGVGVRVLLIVPALLWLALFAGAALSLYELRHLLREGSFRPRPAVVEPVASGR